ncbi:MAG: hypothetical protein EP321_10635 [Sphingomonadales bacterium]|nr:MAG: hypothetical protein EP345_15225 [Sphingomonadales bacterium]TNF03426.1 MAG: hypothetical protein EP321_10635 [Sphingomonadales bacterium]
MTVVLSRRDAMTALGLAAATASAPAAMAAGRRLLLLRDINLGADHDPAAMAIFGQAKARPLFADPVRQWRDGLMQQVERSGHAIALARWNKAHLLQGLGREAGFRATLTRVDDAVYRVDLKA